MHFQDALHLIKKIGVEELLFWCLPSFLSVLPSRFVVTQLHLICKGQVPVLLVIVNGLSDR